MVIQTMGILSSCLMKEAYVQLILTLIFPFTSLINKVPFHYCSMLLKTGYAEKVFQEFFRRCFDDWIRKLSRSRIKSSPAVIYFAFLRIWKGIHIVFPFVSKRFFQFQLIWARSFLVKTKTGEGNQQGKYFCILTWNILWQFRRLIEEG